MSETWLPVVGFEGFYEISDLGRVRSVERHARTYQGQRRVRARILLVSASGKSPYIHANLRREGKAKTLLVHVIVLQAFVGPCPLGCEARHLDGNKLHNAKSNLEWGTPLENAADRLAHGTQPRGESSPASKLTEAAVIEIRASDLTDRELAAKFDVSRRAVGLARNRKTWAHVE